MKTAPAISPTSEPRPPTTTPTRSRIESAIGNVSGLTNVVAIANSDAGDARVGGADAERERLVPRQADARRLRGGLAVAHRAERAALCGRAGSSHATTYADERDRPARGSRASR